MKKIFQGLPLSGKTTRLISEYTRLSREGARTENILVLIMDVQESRKWRRSLDLPVTGSLNIFTFWGFIQREVKKYWDLIQPYFGEGKSVLQPTFLTAESAHYLMTVLVREARGRGCFAGMIATDSQIAIQILDNLNQTAIHGISLEEVNDRLVSTCSGDSRKINAINEAMGVAKTFREQCVGSRCLDYSLMLEVYCRHLLKDPGYLKRLRSACRHLIVDNLEEAVPAEIHLIAKIMEDAENALLAYDPSGGHTRAFGASPELARKIIFPLCELEELDTMYGCSEESRSLAEILSGNIAGGSSERSAQTSVIDSASISTEFRAEMITELGRSIIALLKSGMPPNRIAVIAPAIDRVLESTLGRQLNDSGYKLQNITQKLRLSEEPYAHLMVSIAALIQPGSGWPANMTALSQCFHVILGLDPVRSSLLAECCLKNGMILPDLDQEGLRSRVGFSAGEKYDRFRNSVEKLKSEERTDNLFQLIFREILAPCVEEQGEIVTSRQVIDSAIKYSKAYENLPKLQEQEFVQSFIDMVTQGTVAAEYFRSRELDPEAVILTTPLGLFRTGLSVDRQFWVDCSDISWYFKGYSELSNPEIMGEGWNGTWNDQVEQEIRRRNAAQRIRGLLYRCNGKITIVQSNYSSLGFEQQSDLPEIIFDSVVTKP